ncbi:NUDIX hydrolase [Yoonia sp. 208BN28-4]|uniref:NUDIX hydrolase n=1 Tax=Yoonia sp. 208BN28-4 TaxID=3126505 RepID=UPI00309EDB44
MWTDFITPIYRRPLGLQLAALCHRDGKNGKEVLLISSSRGRWIIPKGWPMDGKTAAEAARIEAWEEAGVQKCHVSEKAVGSILAEKRYDDGRVLPCEVKVFSVKVTKLADDFPEADRRERIWVSPEKAAEMVDDGALKTLFSDLPSR